MRHALMLEIAQKASKSAAKKCNPGEVCANECRAPCKKRGRSLTRAARRACGQDTEHMRLEVVRVEREAKNTVAQVLGDAAVVGHVRELVRFFKTA